MWRIANLFLFVLSFQALAASPYKHSLGIKKNQYLRDGVFVGGKAGEGASLLGVRRSYSVKAKIERVIIDMGDEAAKPLGKDMSYYQVSMDAPNKRIVVDLSQLKLSNINEQQVKNLFKKSPLVSDASLTFDPEDKSGTLVLLLKKPARLEVFELHAAKKPGRVVMDILAL